MKIAEEDTFMRSAKPVALRILQCASRGSLANADLKFEGCGKSTECQCITAYPETANSN